MKKILFITGQLNAGGAERVLIDILRHFDYTKYQVDLCQIIKGGTLIDEVPTNVNIYHVWDNYTLHYKFSYRASNQLGINYFIRKKLKQKITNKYDVVISFLEGMPLKMHAILNPNAINISWVHCDLFNDPYEARQFRKNEEFAAYNKMDKVICVSKSAKESFFKRFPLVKTAVNVVYNPIDNQKIILQANEYFVNRSENFSISVLGRLCPQKCIDRAIRLASNLKQHGYNFHLNIIGDGELRTDLENFSRELSVSDVVTFHGYIKNPYPLIKASDLLLSCSGFEGFSLSICEAMCLGVPVISTKTAGPTEIIGNNEYGILCGHDDQDIFKTVKYAIENRDILVKYSKKALERVKKFSPDNCIEMIENICY